MVLFFNGIVFGQTQNYTICPGESVVLAPTETKAFAYRWTPNNFLSAPNIQKPTAKPSQTTTYTVESSIRTDNNLVRNADFELGDVEFTSKYKSTAETRFSQGSYGISDNPNLFNRVFTNCEDHTGTGDRKMLIADGACGSNGVAKNIDVWIQTITVSPNTDYAFSAWLTNVINKPSASSSYLKFSINGVEIGSPPPTSSLPCNWEQFYVVWNSGSNTTATISIAEAGGECDGNDFALDDIAFYKIIKTTETIAVNVRIPDAVPVISGSSAVCINKTTTVGSSLNGGTWNSSNPSVATVDVNGNISPVNIGTTAIQYIHNDICNTPSSPFSITVTEPPVFNEITGINKLAVGQQSPLTINSSNGAWQSSDESVVQVLPDGTAKAIGEGEVDVTYAVSTPCEVSSLPFKISVIKQDDLYVPTAFSPNRDGSNDVFKIYGSLISEIELDVFNQWGELVFKSTDLTNGWDGSYKAQLQPAGVYIYSAKIKMLLGNTVFKKGVINLIR